MIPLIFQISNQTILKDYFITQMIFRKLKPFRSIPFAHWNGRSARMNSYMPTDLRLGECLLWTVESVRLNYDQTSEFKKYPSLVPQLIIPGGTWELQIASVDDLNRAYNLYLAWWTNNKTKDFDDFRNINPLKDAVLMWR